MHKQWLLQMHTLIVWYVFLETTTQNNLLCCFQKELCNSTISFGFKLKGDSDMNIITNIPCDWEDSEIIPASLMPVSEQQNKCESKNESWLWWEYTVTGVSLNLINKPCKRKLCVWRLKCHSFYYTINWGFMSSVEISSFQFEMLQCSY